MRFPTHRRAARAPPVRQVVRRRATVVAARRPNCSTNHLAAPARGGPGSHPSQEIDMRAPKASTFLLAPVVSAALAAMLAACGGDAPTSPSAASVDAKRSLTATGLAATRCTLPFRGVLNATESDELLFPTLHVHLVGDGTASHVGRYTMTLKTTVTLPQATSEGGILRLTAANGDVVTASVSGF